ncbi:MAG: amidase [Rhizobiales bacterium]|nr:amidase [Hyphomicrobiales bacterium]
MTHVEVAEPAPAGSHELALLPATELLKGYAEGRFTPVDVVEDVIGALKATDALCNIVVTDMYDAARVQAEQAAAAWAAGAPKGRLCGIPVTIKDLLFVAGVPAHAGSPAFADFVPSDDSAVVALLKAEGAVLTCKTTTCESGYKLTADSPLTGITRNPWHLGRTSGGSSGGAVAGVAAGCGPLAIGTDAVGSIRVPSSFCGVFGIKPTFGLVPRAPSFFPPSWGSLAHTGPIGWTVADVALLLGVIAGYDRRDAVSLPQPPRAFDATPVGLAGLRIGVSRDFGYAAVAPDVRAAFDAAVDALAAGGAELVPIDAAFGADMLETILKPIGYTEQATAAMGRDAEDLARSEPEFQAVVARGKGFSGTDYMAATHRRAQLRSRFLSLFGTVDALVTPTVAVTAFAAGTFGVDAVDGVPVDRHLGWSPFSWPINLSGLPAASVPCGFDADGLPIGLQVVAPWLGEPTIIRIAAAFEAARPWAGTRPGFRS